MSTKFLMAEVAAPLVDRVDAMASRMAVQRDRVVEQALTAWVAREENHRTRTLEGLADVDAGRLIDDATVEAWAASLATDDELLVPLER